MGCSARTRFRERRKFCSLVNKEQWLSDMLFRISYGRKMTQFCKTLSCVNWTQLQRDGKVWKLHQRCSNIRQVSLLTCQQHLTTTAQPSWSSPQMLIAKISNGANGRAATLEHGPSALTIGRKLKIPPAQTGRHTFTACRQVKNVTDQQRRSLPSSETGACRCSSQCVGCRWSSLKVRETVHMCLGYRRVIELYTKLKFYGIGHFFTMTDKWSMSWWHAVV